MIGPAHAERGQRHRPRRSRLVFSNGPGCRSRTRSPTFLPSWRKRHRAQLDHSQDPEEALRPLVVGVAEAELRRRRPSAGTNRPSTENSLREQRVLRCAAHVGWLLNPAPFITPARRSSMRTHSLWMTRSSSSRSRAGCAVRPPRRALNTTAVTPAVTAATEPSSAERTGTRPARPRPARTRCRSAHDGGEWRGPAAAAGPGYGGRADARLACARPDRPDRQDGQQADQGQAEHSRARDEDEPVGTDPAVRVEAHRPHRRQRRERHRAAATASAGAGHDGGRAAGSAGRRRRLAAAGAQHAEHRDVRGRPADHLRQALPHQHQHGQRRNGAEHAQRDRLGLIACCTWPRMTSVRLMLNVGALTLRCVACCSCRCRSAASVASCRCRFRNSSRASGQAQPDPRVVVRGQQLPGRPGEARMVPL